MNSSLKDLPVLNVDSFKLPQVWDMCARTKVVVSMVGPFAMYGNAVVHSCVKNGTDYCDITGEVNWVRYNFHKYQKEARKTGARLVFSAGCDSVPWDLATFLLNVETKKDADDALVRVVHANDAKLTFSGGTLSTILNMVDGKFTCPIRPRPKFDPLVGDFTGEDLGKSKSKLLIQNQMGLSRVGGSDSRWKMLSVFAGGNSRIVSISQSQLNYSSKLVYTEYNVENSLLNAMNNFLGLILLVTCVLLKPLRNLLLKYSLLPNPGQGPSLEQIKSHYFVVESTGYTQKGRKIQLHTKFNEDIGYKDTARMLVESGLCFVFNEEGVSQKGGLFSPAACLGLELKNRLEKTGTEFKLLAS